MRNVDADRSGTVGTFTHIYSRIDPMSSVTSNALRKTGTMKNTELNFRIIYYNNNNSLNMLI